MTKKRYFLHKHFIKNDVIHDKICHKWLKGEELESNMNTLYNKYSSFKKENEQLKQEKDYFEKKKCEYWNKFNLAYLDNINLRKENEQLKIKLIYNFIKNNIIPKYDVLCSCKVQDNEFYIEYDEFLSFDERNILNRGILQQIYDFCVSLDIEEDCFFNISVFLVIKK